MTTANMKASPMIR